MNQSQSSQHINTLYSIDGKLSRVIDLLSEANSLLRGGATVTQEVQSTGKKKKAKKVRQEGEPKPNNNSFIHYSKYIKKLISEGKFLENGVKVEKLSPKELAARWKKERGFVLHPTNPYTDKPVDKYDKNQKKTVRVIDKKPNWIEKNQPTKIALHFLEVAKKDKERFEKEKAEWEAKQANTQVSQKQTETQSTDPGLSKDFEAVSQTPQTKKVESMNQSFNVNNEVDFDLSY